jgi:hypothetical protein
MDRNLAEAEALAAEARLGRLPAYVRERLIDLLMRCEPIPALPGEVGFREADWLA